MKHSDSTEMDRLLRRHARRHGEALRAGAERERDLPEAKGGAHLDADELNAYAEGAIPEATRSRYFAHLADCDACRQLVTELTLAAVATEEAKERVVAATAIKPAPSNSWREWLAALFSPPVLRYGVPALALFAVIVVAIVALRPKGENSFVAQKEEARNYNSSITANSDSAAEPAATPAASTDHSMSNTSAAGEPIAQGQPQMPSATPAPATTGPADDKVPAQPPSVNDESAPGRNATGNPVAGVFGEDTKRGERAESTTPADNPQPKTAPDADARRREGGQEQERAAKEKDATTAGSSNADSVAQNKPAKTENSTDTGGVASTTTSSRTTQSLPAMRKAAPAPLASAGARNEVGRERDEEVQLSAETRSVGGHRFRRQGSAWVDTAYNASRPTTSVARGSEQYRALVADEPALRSITQQLGGEVIVVWGKKAYRFY